jgi:hypothetical protein
MGLRDDMLARAKDRRHRHREEVTTTFAAAGQGWAALVKDRRLYAQRMSGHDRSTYEDHRDVFGPDPERGLGAIKRTGLNLKNLDAQLVVRCLADEGGALVLVPDDAAVLGEADSALLRELAAACERVNGMSTGPDLKNGRTPAGSGGPPGSSDALPLSSSSGATPSS